VNFAERRERVARWRWFPVLLLAAVIVVGYAAPSSWTYTAINVPIQGLLALSVGVLFYRVGALALCPLTFAAVGVWVFAWFSQHTSLPFAALLLLGVVATVPAGLVLGGLSLRLRGASLAVITLTFAVAMQTVFNQNEFPGTLSQTRVPRPWGLGSDRGYYLFCVLVFLVVGAGLAWHDRRRGGRAWRAVRHSERAAAAAGLHIHRVKLQGFVISAAIAGLAGGLIIGQTQTIPTTAGFDPISSLVIVAVAVMTGASGLSGAVLAGLLASVLPEIVVTLGWAPDYPQMLFGLGACQALATHSGGIASAFPWNRPRRSSAPPPAAVGAPSADRVAAREREPVLEVRSMSVSYGAVKALDGVDLIVPAGSVLGIIGPNGSGKTTLVDAVSGFTRYGGTVRLAGHALDKLGATGRARAGVRRTFQQGRAVPDLTVGGYVNLFRDRPLAARELDELLAFFSLPSAEEPIAFIDVGTRRIVELAGCLAARPRVLFLDEPLAGIGDVQASELQERIAEIPGRFGCAIVVIEHHLEMVASLCESIVVLDFGKVIAVGAPEEALRSPLVASAYLGSDINLPRGQLASGAQTDVDE
jgi:branched-chain amino acid transport system permease protein